MPLVSFPGRIFVIQTISEAEKAISYLEQFTLIGLDTETRPTFRKGETHKVALLQLSTHDTCFLFRLNFIGLPDCVIRLLSSKEITKVGVSLHDDIIMLKRRRDFSPEGFLDLQSVVKDFDIEDQSLQKIYANIFHQRISKGQRLSNWEADILTEKQKVYSATDAWACVKLYDELRNLKRLHDFKIIKDVQPTI